MQSDDFGAEIRQILDIEAIKQLKAQYARLVDAKEWEAWGQLFTEDGHLHTDGAPVDGRERIVARVSTALAQAVSVHRMYTPEIMLTGPDTASAIWPMTDYVTGTVNGAPLNLRGYGHYHEDYVRKADGWRIKRSRLIRQRRDLTPSEPA